MFLRHSFAAMVVLGLVSQDASAGGPRWVAGTTYFQPGSAGRPVTWLNGSVAYFTDLGDLSPTVSQTQANAMVALAAALWSEIPTAAVSIVRAVIDALDGFGASDPISCSTSGVITLVDNFSVGASVSHALILVNGRCATDAPHIALIQYELLRGFGRILGLDWSQANDQMFPANTTTEGLAGWPLMHPVEKLCNSNGNPCMTGAISPRTDDVSALNRLYPVTPANAARFPRKTVTASATISIQGTIRFRIGQGMQGVNVVARPLVPGTNQPDMRFPVSAVSGSLFRGNSGNAVTGPDDLSGTDLSAFGTTSVALEGWYDLSCIPLPPGVSSADYLLTFEPVNPAYTRSDSVGPYALGQVAPSGDMPQVVLRGLTAGSVVTRDEEIGDSAADENSGDDGLEDAPAPIPVNGEWQARLGSFGHQSWLRWHIQGGNSVSRSSPWMNADFLPIKKPVR